jgi:hypothetical protein
VHPARPDHAGADPRHRPGRGRQMTDRHAPARETAATAAQYILLGGFACVAAGISAQGLTGFARSNMGLRGPWPYLLFFALDGAAGVCAVLLARRAARNDGGMAPRLAVWGLVAASASFNFTHAPRRPAAPQAYALMPVVAAVLFEFCLREMKVRRTGRADRKLTGLRWLHPAERVRVQAHLAAHEQASAGEATRRVQIDQAARRLYQLRMALRAHDRPGRPGRMAAARVRRAQRRAHAALTRAGFTMPDVGIEILREVQVLTMTTTLARLDYATPEAAQAAIGNLITSPAGPGPQPGVIQAQSPASDRPHAEITADKTAGAVNGHAFGGKAPAAMRGAGPSDGTPVPVPAGPADGPATVPGEAANSDDHARLIAAATRIVADAAQEDSPLNQAALAEKLRIQGYGVSNDRLRWLWSVANGLDPRNARPPVRRASKRARQHQEEPAPVTGAARPAPVSSADAAQDAGPDQARTGEPVAGGQRMQPPGGQ